jgi:Domain of unknown function (DUF4160)
MVKIHRERGFEVVLYPGDKEHTPPHVHIFYGDEEVKIALGDEDTAPWVWEVSRALVIVEDYQESFLANWRKYHGA